ncbi:MAG: hypothetical protein IPG87_06145 [Saprospiraceae bacterium]|nr:hypothetical protein [Candidatus Vicinibacter affinis]
MGVRAQMARFEDVGSNGRYWSSTATPRAGDNSSYLSFSDGSAEVQHWQQSDRAFSSLH